MKIEANSMILDRAELAALLLSASADECRVNLYQMHVDPAAGVAVTTDGHRMTVATGLGTRPPSARSVNLPLPMLRDAVKAAKVRDAIAVRWTDEDACSAEVGTLDPEGDGVIGTVRVAGTLSSAVFPPWRAVFPDALHPSSVPLTMNPHYFADVLTAVAKLQGKTATVTCYGPALGTARRGCTADEDAKLSPIVFVACDLDRGEWRMIVMPMRPVSDPIDWRIARHVAAEGKVAA